MKTIAVICARGGSKGVPGKNIKKIAGKPLIAHSIECAKNCNFIERIIVSTDDSKIAKVAEKYGAEVPYKRPKHLATDKASTTDTVLHLLKWLEKNENYVPDMIFLLDATCPIRKECDLWDCFEVMSHKKYDAAITVCETHANPYFNMVEPDGKGFVQLSKMLPKRPSCRQSAPSTYWINSSVWAIKTECFIEEQTFIPKKTAMVIMPEERSYHIDTENDFKIVKFLMGDLK